MKNKEIFDVIIIGGSYAGLSAAMSLGRSLRKVLIIDNGKPCNEQSPHSHNFITQDGNSPQEISSKAKSQVLKYDTVKFINGLATNGKMVNGLFEIGLDSSETFKAKKILFATGLKDLFPNIEGFPECWGISILHCPYCHGYEVKHQKIGLLGNGDAGFGLAKLISNWTENLTLFTNGKSKLTAEQTRKLDQHQIKIVENKISRFEHDKGYIQEIIFNDGSKENLTALFARIDFKQHCEIPQEMGCELTEHGFIKVDDLQRTSVSGIYAAGDNSHGLRAVSAAAAAGNKAGAIINHDLIDETF